MIDGFVVATAPYCGCISLAPEILERKIKWHGARWERVGDWFAEVGRWAGQWGLESAWRAFLRVS